MKDRSEYAKVMGLQSIAFPLIDRESWSMRHQYPIFIIISIGVIGVTALLVPTSKAFFQPFFGGMQPILAVVSAAIVGGVSLRLLRTFGGFEIFKGRMTLRGIAVSAGFATLLGIAIIIADILIRYGEDMNVPVPEALLFYPAMGFVAEMVFHIFPLALLLVVLAPLRSRYHPNRFAWAGIIVVAVLEPTFQIVFAGEPLSWADMYTWVHVFAIAFLQLYVFKRYDFVSMYSFRLVYYAYWHIVWGVIRLKVLF